MLHLSRIARIAQILIASLVGCVLLFFVVLVRQYSLGKLTGETFTEIIDRFILLFVPLITLLVGYYFSAQSYSAVSESYEKKIGEIEAKAEQQPERARLAWDIASIKLEAYFNRNLEQVNLIFWISVTVMAVGFAFILFAINKSLTQPQVITASYIASIAGVVTELIGATFMLIYRSTMRQASTYMSTLERINSVGMAVQILDSISAENVELKNATKSELVKLLLQSQAVANRESR